MRTIIFLIALLVAVPAAAQCGPRGCPIPRRSAPDQVQPDQAKPDQTASKGRVRRVMITIKARGRLRLVPRRR